MDDNQVKLSWPLVITLFLIGTGIAIGIVLVLVFVFEMLATTAAQVISLM